MTREPDKYDLDHLSSEETDRLLQQLLKDKFDQEYKDKLDRLAKEKGISDRSTHTKKRLFNLPKSLFIALAIIVLALVSWLLFNRYQANHIQPEHIAGKYITELNIPPPPSIRSGQVEIDQLRSLSNSAYINGRYDEVVRLKKQLIASGQADPQDYFYLGIAQLKADQVNVQEAIETFNQIDPNSGFSEELGWMKGLAFAKSVQTDSAVLYLEQIVHQKTYGHRKAKLLLKAMN